MSPGDYMEDPKQHIMVRDRGRGWERQTEREKEQAKNSGLGSAFIGVEGGA